MTTRIIQSIDALHHLEIALPDFSKNLENKVDEVMKIYQELEYMYNERAAIAYQQYEQSMEEISGLLNCSHSERCDCVSEYESRASACRQQLQSVIQKLDAIFDPVKSRMNTTPMFDSLKICVNEQGRYADGLRNLIQVAREYLQA